MFTREYLLQHWAVLLAAVLGAGVFLFVLLRVLQDSTRGRLRALVVSLRRHENDAVAAAKVVARAARKLERLRAKADSVKPRHGQEAQHALEDAQALLKIAQDQVLVAKNHVRKHIVEEYPRKRHAALRGKYLGHEETEQKPFTMAD